MDLGTKRENSEPSIAPGQDESGVSYPGFSLNDSKVKEFLEENPVTMGDVITFTGRAKVTGMSDQRYGTSLQFDLLSMEDCKKETDEQEEEEQGGSVFANPAMRHMTRKKHED